MPAEKADTLAINVMNSKFCNSTATELLSEPWAAPNAPAASPVALTSDDKWGQGFAGRPKRKVLVAEDDDDCLLVLKTLLSGKGYQVLAAWDGKQALEIANTEEFDLVILDLQLPRLSGLSVIHHLRRRPELESVPIVIMTGWAPEEYREKAIEAGCDDFLVKPIDFDHLDAVLDYFAPIPTAEAMGAA